MKPQIFKLFIYCSILFALSNASAQSSKWNHHNFASSGQCAISSYVDAAFDNSGNTYALGVNLVTYPDFCFKQGNIHVDKINSTGAVTASYDYDFDNLEGEDYPYEIRTDNSANVYVLGYSHNNMILIKLNSSLSFQWEKRFYDLTPENMGLGQKNIYVTGNTPEGAAVVRYAQSNGAWLSYQLYESARVNDGVVTSDGYAITGRVGSASNANELFVQRYDSLLTLKWTSTFHKSSGNYNDEGSQIKYVNDNIYIGGITNNSSAANIGLLVKYNGTGTLQWNKLINVGSGTNYVSFSRLNVDSYNEDVYVLGFKTTSRIIKYNTAGTKLWSKSIAIAGTDATTINDVANDATSAAAATKVCLAGQNNYTIGGFQHFERCFLYMINASNGSFAYSDYDEGDGFYYDPSFSFTRVKTNNKVSPAEFIALGSGRTEDGNPQASGSIGFADCYNSTGTPRIASYEKQFTVIPNPATDEINITLPDTYEKIDITSADGKIVKSITAIDEITIIKINDLKPGVYLIRISGLNGTMNTKLIKE